MPLREILVMMAYGLRGRIVIAPLILWLVVTATANAEPSGSPSLGHRVAEDFQYAVDNIQLDVRDIVTSPLSIISENSVLRSPRFYLALAGVAALWVGSFALDQTMRSHLHQMSPRDADLLQNISYGSIGVSSAALYAYGLYSDDSRTRQYMLTGAEGAGLATGLVNVAIKPAFGRPRPKDKQSQPHRVLPRRLVVRVRRRHSGVRAGGGH